MSIYSNDNIRKIAKLTTRELPQKSKNAKITVRENNGLYSNRFPVEVFHHVQYEKPHQWNHWLPSANSGHEMALFM